MLQNTEETQRVARCFGEVLSGGDTLLLEGEVGSGKTDFARRVIQSLQNELGNVEDVPSPTFTLVQTYELGDIEVWHADLYRLNNTDELFEIGLETAFGKALCLVEWPARLGDLAPPDALTLKLEITGETSRRLTLEWRAAKWNTVPDMIAFVLDQSGSQYG